MIFDYIEITKLVISHNSDVLIKSSIFTICVSTYVALILTVS